MTLETFIARALALDVGVRRASDVEHCRTIVTELIGEGPALIDRGPALDGLSAKAPGDPWDAAIGVSEAFSAAAEAGAVALVQRAGSPRRTSLLPPNHVVVVRAEQVRDTYQQMVDDIAAMDPPPTGVQLISGASRSGDIESAMIHGMHGPRHLTFVIVG